jgi:uncharacterized coiled-coil DUF342 family protein
MSKKAMAKIVEINKQELSSERVELALDLRDLKSYAKNLKTKFDSYNKKFVALDGMVRDVRDEAGELDKLYNKFYQELKETSKELDAKSKELGLKRNDTPIGKELDAISNDILNGKYDTYKKGLSIDIS